MEFSRNLSMAEWGNDQWTTEFIAVRDGAIA